MTRYEVQMREKKKKEGIQEKILIHDQKVKINKRRNQRSRSETKR